ncbi:VTC domain-containing protein [Phycomyces blakesleeanus]|uniref:VTC domain-containing protein n=2 Tax=Phycomyces blakesleeanus TaxID=4837 RepID=A0ABR3AHE7_PHYBL
MKFGVELAAKIHEPWRYSYLQYNELKVELKRRQLEQGWRERDEREFVEFLQRELIKVFNFVNEKLEGIQKRIEQSECTIQELMKSEKINTQSYELAADELAEILFAVNDLSKFHQLNYTGFEKIVKKHDRWTKLDLRSRFYGQMLETWPLDQQRFDALIVRISNIHDLCRLRGQPRATNAYSQGGDQTAFERETAKYWIHPDYITEVKSIIMMHLPVHVFNQKKTYEDGDAAISSVYFDNASFDLYSERLERIEGAEAIRFRWYGDSTDKDNNSVYVERKTHHAPWLNGHSVKDRFRLDEKYIDAYMTGSYTADTYASDLRLKGKMDEAKIEENHFVAKGVQDSLRNRQLQPMCRVFYNRTAFQLPGDQRVRVSLDNNMTFVREDGLDGVRRQQPEGDMWRRGDVGIQYPFRNVKDSDILRFPYAILETKIQSHLGQETPAWLTELVTSHLVHEVPRFSKYLHGASQLFKDRVPVVPWWLSELNIDIRKTPVADVGLSRSMSFKPLFNGRHRRSIVDVNYQQVLPLTVSRSAPHVSIQLTNDQPEHAFYNLSEAPKDKRDAFTRFWSGSLPNFDKKQTSSRDKSGQPVGILPIAVQRRAPLKKIDPKAFFANERTFISWLQFCALLLTVSLNLLNYGDSVSRIIGAFFIIISSFMSIYALVRFQLRAWQMRTGNTSLRYDDIYGPVVLCVLMITALGVNFYLRAPLLAASVTPTQVTP